MNWNYRVVKSMVENQPQYEIHEVYYDKDGNPTMYSAVAVKPFGETLKQLKKDHKRMHRALKLPILEYGKITLQELGLAPDPWVAGTKGIPLEELMGDTTQQILEKLEV